MHVDHTDCTRIDLRILTEFIVVATVHLYIHPLYMTNAPQEIYNVGIWQLEEKKLHVSWVSKLKQRSGLPKV